MDDRTAADKPIVEMITIRRDLYFVMSLLLADKAVIKTPGMVAWTQDFHDGEVRRLMLWVATAMRGVLDLSPAENDFSARNCGEYWANFPKEKKGELSFRQACNSVIHAKEITLYLDPVTKTKTSVRQGYVDRITIRGEHRNCTTRAELDIIAFVKTATALIDSLEE